MLVAVVGGTFAASVALVGARGMVGLVGARQFFLALVGAGRRLFACVWLAGALPAPFLFTFTAQICFHSRARRAEPTAKVDGLRRK